MEEDSVFFTFSLSLVVGKGLEIVYFVTLSKSLSLMIFLFYSEVKL